MRYVKKHAKAASYRTLSFVLAFAVFVGLFAGVIGVISILAGRPLTVDSLNTTTQVQKIDLRPVTVSNDGSTRTSFIGSYNTDEYTEVVENSDGSVTYKMKQKYDHGDTEDNNYLGIQTRIGQKINLKDNPYLTLHWESNTKMNCYIGFSMTTENGGTKKYFNTTVTDSSAAIKNATQDFTYKNYPDSKFSLYNMYKDRINNSSDVEGNDFPAWTEADISINFYDYFYKFMKDKWNFASNSEYLPDFTKEGEYITIEYVTFFIVGKSVGEPLYEDAYVTLNEFSVGKTALHPQNDLAPRVSGSVETGYNGNYNQGRSQRLDDDSYVFLNPSETAKAIFKWQVYRYVNVSELESLLFDADYEHNNKEMPYDGGYTPDEGKKYDFTMRFSLHGYNATPSGSATTKFRGFNAYLDTMLDDFSESSDASDVVGKYKNRIIDFEQVCETYADVIHDAPAGGLTNGNTDYATVPNAEFSPQDGLVFIRDITLTLPPLSKLTINRFSFAAENVYATAVTPDTSYPWGGTKPADTTPDPGTTVLSSDISDNYSYASQDWVTETAPDVAQKYDLLQLFYNGATYDENGQLLSYNGTENGFWRTLDSGSYFTSTDSTTFKAFTFSHQSNILVDPEKTPYLYYSYELSGDDAAFAVHMEYKHDSSTSTDYQNSHHFLSADGKAVYDCSLLMTSDDVTQKKNDALQRAYRSMSTSATARTGVIDLRKMDCNTTSDGKIPLNKLNIYLKGGTADAPAKLHIRYLFFGSVSINMDTLNSTANAYKKIPINDDNTYAWTTTNEQFHQTTYGTDNNVKFVFANRVDMLSDLVDRAEYHAQVLKANKEAGKKDHIDENIDTSTTINDSTVAYILDSDGYVNSDTSFTAANNGKTNFSFARTDDGQVESITVKVNENEQYVHVGSYQTGSWDNPADYSWNAANEDGNSLDKFRYLHYSVEADEGMRWAIMLSFDGNDHVSRVWNTNGNIDASSLHITNEYYYRYSSGAEDYAVAITHAIHRQWAMFAVPGSETGCIDLKEWCENENLDWTKLVCVRLIAYKDATVKAENGIDDVSGEVTFHYVHFTSAPLNKSSWGTLPYSETYNPGNTNDGSHYFNRSYSWPLSSDNTIDYKNNFTSSLFNRSSTPTGFGAVDYIFSGNDSSGTTMKLTSNTYSNIKVCYSLFYSFSIYDTVSKKYISTPFMISFFNHDYTDYLYHGRNDALGKIDLKQKSEDGEIDTKFRDCYRLQYAECGQIELKQFNLDDLYKVRFYFDEKYLNSDRYTIDATLRFAMNSEGRSTNIGSTKYATQSKSLTALSGYTVSFDDCQTTATDTTNVSLADNTPRTESKPYYKKSNDSSFSMPYHVIDLNNMPYLYYSMTSVNGGAGSFGLGIIVGDTMSTNQKVYYVYRDGSQTLGESMFTFSQLTYDLSTDGAIAKETAISTESYMTDTENGCYDLRALLLRNGVITEQNAVISVVLKYIAVDNTDGGYVVYDYLFMDTPLEKSIDLLPDRAGGNLESGTATRTWVYTYEGRAQLGELAFTTEQGIATDDSYDAYNQDSVYESVSCTHYTNMNDVYHIDNTPTLQISHGADTEDDNADGYNDLVYYNNGDAWFSVNYGAVTRSSTDSRLHFTTNGQEFDYNYLYTGNGQTSGITVDLSETPYLHFSFSQEEGSRTAFILQTNGAHFYDSDVLGVPANQVKPWISAYSPLSPAGQMVHVAPSSKSVMCYKDFVWGEDSGCFVSGNFSGVIDLRSWYTQTNGFDDEISLERIRFYTTNNQGEPTEVKVNHFYLSSSSASAYSVTFDNNTPEDEETPEKEHLSHTVQVLHNANPQYVSDGVVNTYKTREGYTFVGWYTDPDWENYFDISSQPITENMTLYAGWIADDEVITQPEEDGRELNLLENAATSEDGKVIVDEDAVHVNNDGDTAYTVEISVNKAYAMLSTKSIYVGIDTADTMQTYLGRDENDELPEGFKLEIELKSLGTHKYDLVGYSFGDRFSDDSVLEAAPYDRELPMYMQLSGLNLRPDLITENQERGLVYVKNVIVTVPAGCSVAIRYLTAAKELAYSSLEVVAPEITGNILDLLDPGGDMGFVEQRNNVFYDLPTKDDVTSIYNRTFEPTVLYQAEMSSPSSGYLTLGGKYGLGETIGSIAINPNGDNTEPDKYLYFSVDQAEESYTTFIIWSEIKYYDVSARAPKNSYGAKHATFFNYEKYLEGDEDGGLSSYDDLVGGHMPRAAYFNGSLTGCINLTEWYKTALEDVHQADYDNDYVTSVKITGIRMYTLNSGTKAKYNYLAIGGAPTKDTDSHPVASVINAGGETVSVTLDETLTKGQTVRVSLDQLTDSVAAQDPQRVFCGWSFSENGDPVWWNPNAKNARMYDDDTNPEGAWSSSQVDDFVQTRRDIAYQFTDNTATLYPVFKDADQKTKLSLNVTATNSGSVSVKHGNATYTANSSYSTEVSYGDTVTLSVADTANFIGWYDASGNLLSDTKDYVFSLYTDTAVTAEFDAAGDTVAQQLFRYDASNTSIVWLERADNGAGTAGTGFYLSSVNSGGKIQSPVYSNIADTEGSEDIACYWMLTDGQTLDAVAPEGYHWHMLLQDGSTVCLGEENTYRFISSLNMKLICTPIADSCDTVATVIVNEYAVDFERSTQSHTAQINGQVFTADNEQLVSCGFVMANRPSGVSVPSIGSPESATYAANAWNSTTGQFTVEVAYTPGMARYVRGYAMIRNTETGAYTLRYSDYVTLSF